jgi:AraC-like DNA-binding protein
MVLSCWKKVDSILENIDSTKNKQYSIKPIDELYLKTASQRRTFFENYVPSEYTESHRVICTPSAFAKSTLFYIQEIGKLKSLKSHISKRESLDSYLYIIIKAGSGTFTFEGRTYSVKAGNHIFIECRKAYSHTSSDSDPWELLWVHFNGNLTNKYYEYYSNHNIAPLYKPDNSLEIINVLEKLMVLASNNDTHTELISSNLLNTLVTMILIQTTAPPSNIPNTTTEKINQIKEYIDNNFQKKIHLDMMAEEFYISKYHMSREFKKAYGITIANFITAKRITYAKELLRFTDMQIEEIGRICGIEDNSYFNKLFRKFEGMTASDYRKKWKGVK